MNNMRHPIAPDFTLAVPLFATPCEECEGTGFVTLVGRVSGEAFDADYIEVSCDDCSGTGEMACNAACPECLEELTGSECEICESRFVDASVTSLGDDWHRVVPK